MAAVLAAASYSRIGFSIYFAVSARVWEFQVEVTSTWNQEQYILLALINTFSHKPMETIKFGKKIEKTLLNST